MKRLALLPLLAFVLVPTASHAAGCSPLDCGPTALPIAGTHMLAVRPNGLNGPLRALDLRAGTTRYRLPTGVLAGMRYVARVPSARELAWYDARSGRAVARAVAPDGWMLVGASADGRRAVLSVVERDAHRFMLVHPDGRTRRVDLPHGIWTFDALAGKRLYLLQFLRHGYEVRLYDLARGRLEPKPLKDAGESAVIAGNPWQRVASADGRYLFTLYLDGDGKAMVHELDLRSATARCIDLPGTGDFNAGSAYALTVGRDGTLWAASVGYGKVAAIDIASARIRSEFSFAPRAVSAPVGTASALSPDGSQLALASLGKVWFVDLPRRRVSVQPHVAIAVGFAADGRRLWVVGERSRVSALPVRH